MTHLEKLDSILLWYRVYTQMQHPKDDTEDADLKTATSQSGTSMEADNDK